MTDAGYFSDESDFYGDETTRNELEVRAMNFDADEWWAKRRPSLIDIARENTEAAAKSEKKKALLYNPYAGFRCARQLEEKVENFLERLPPATTPVSEDFPWIYIANPYHKAEKGQGGRKLADEEAPSTGDANWAEFVREGTRLLHQLTDLRHEVEKQNPKKAKSTITTMIKDRKDSIVDKILDKAEELKCTSGKWMIFCEPKDVNLFWARVAEDTANANLGIAAKVTPDNGRDRSDRLICVYTKDFNNEEDISRVLYKLKELEVAGKGKQIFYKCDAYTYLGLTSTNEYGIKASMYGSKDFFDAKPGFKKERMRRRLLYKAKKDYGDVARVDYE
ncbi:uncharacterized protein L3040_003813 [Drepanopeziza brunnea f. sp. 'multigermtubi']|uniref:uncharacterized protein n=1 Tax=Drepanopeziza brunnea f. sp. 'multigermtubi' TaxID=698441 RepID=UPI002386B99F|nr:hypothetical protein L3040_003813 [Drepanopeziza brunnea f. sp. 'multigermtubi']